MVEKRAKTSVVLFKKALKDFYVNYKQFLALILIATLAFTLYLGLGANYRSFSKRVNSLYTKGKAADLIVTTTGLNDDDFPVFENIAKEHFNKDNLSDNDIDYRLFFRSLVTYRPSENEGLKNLGFSVTHNILVTKKPIYKQKISSSSKILDDKKEEIKEEKIGEGIFISPKYFSNIKPGTVFELDILKSSILYLLKASGLHFDSDTGYITLTTQDGKINEIINEERLSKLDSIDSLIKLNEESYLKPNAKNPLTRSEYLKISREFFAGKGYFKVPVRFAGYAMHPESVKKDGNDGFLFADYDYLLKQIKKALVNVDEKYLPFISMLYFFLDTTINNLTETEAKNLNEESLLKKEVFTKNAFLNNYKYSKELLKYFAPAFFGKFNRVIASSVTDEEKVLLKTKLSEYDTLIFEKIQKRKYNQVIYKNADFEKIEKVKNEINRAFEKNKERIIFNRKLSESITNITLETDMKQAKQLNYVFPIIFFIVAILVIITTTSQIILRERTQIGTLKALGYTNLSIFLYYIFFIFSLILLGVILGAIIGPLLLPYILDQKYKNLYNLPKPSYVFPYIELLISLGSVFIIVLVITFLVCQKEIRLLPAVSMRPASPKIKLKVKSKKRNVSMQMAFRNIRINKVRSILTIIGVMGCCALLISGMGLRDTINYGINYDMKRYYNNSDIAVTIQPQRTDILEKIERLDGIKKLESYFNVVANVKDLNSNLSTEMQLYAFHSNSLFYKPGEKDKHNKGEVLLHKKYAERLNAKLGDEIVFNIGEKEVKFTIGAISDSFFVQGVVFNLDDIENYREISSGVMIALEKGVKVDAVVDKIKELDGIGIVLTNAATVRLLKSVNTVVFIVATTIFIFALLLATVVLYNLARLNLNERTREIATLKVLGFNRHEISRSIFIEMFFLSVVGTLLGLALGFPMLYSILVTNRMEMVTYIYYIRWESFVAAFLIMMILAVGINIYISVKSNKIKMIESLKSIE